MSLETGMEHVENTHFSRQQSEIALPSSPIAMVTAAAVSVRVDANAASSAAPAVIVPLTTVANDGGATSCVTEDGSPLNNRSTPAAMESNKTTAMAVQTDNRNIGTNQSNSTAHIAAGNTKASVAAGKRKRRRGKSQRGKSSSNRPYSKTQWKYHSSFGQQGRAGSGGVTAGSGSSKRRTDYHQALAGARRKTPFLLSDQPPLVPYNTNRFLMEDHMPQVLTPSEDEEDFLTKEFSDVYEKARFEQLESLSHSELIQEYIKLALDYEQNFRRSAYTGITVGKFTTADIETVPGDAGGERNGDAPKDDGGISKESRLEDRVRELMAENIELRRQLDQASRMGLVLCGNRGSERASFLGAATSDRMDIGEQCVAAESSTSEDSESDSSSTSSSTSSSSSSSSSSASSMSDDEHHGERECDEPMATAAAEAGLNGSLLNSPVGSPAGHGVDFHANGDGLDDGDGEDVEQPLLLNGVEDLSSSPQARLAVE